MRVNAPADAPLTAEAALERLLSEGAPLPPERVLLSEAAGRVLCGGVRARLDGPPFTNSARDGYAVRAEELCGASRDNPASLFLAPAVMAGDGPPPPLPPAHAARVMTGAPIPPGADAVVMREMAREEGGAVRLFHSPASGEHVRPQGEDFRRGDALSGHSSLLRPWEIALLASQGIAGVDVRRRPRAAVVVTGDEVALPGENLRPGALYDANGPALAASAARAGAAVTGVFHAPDDFPRLTSVLARALTAADVLLVSGGVSVGDRDHTRQAFAALGARELFWRVAIRPGAPLLAAVAPGGKFLFGLPGNPLSALVCFEEFVRPLLAALQGAPRTGDPFPLKGKALNGFRKPASLRQYLFVRREGDGLRIPPQGSALLRTAAGADALATAPLGTEEIRLGDELCFRELT